jgi:hypothetical protein
VVIVTAGIAAWQIFLVPEPQPIVYVRVDRDSGRRPALPADPGILTKDVDTRRAGADRAGRGRPEADGGAAERARRPQAGGQRRRAGHHAGLAGRARAVHRPRHQHRAGPRHRRRPRLIRQRPRGAAAHQRPRHHTVLVSRIEPTNRIAIGFTKGDRGATTLLMFDDAGRVQQTFYVECTAAAF